MATRADVERDVALLLGEDVDSAGFGEPLWLRRVVTEATNHVARVADAYYTYYTMDLAGSTGSPVTRLCIPGEMYKPKKVEVILSNNSHITLGPESFKTPEGLERYFPNWQGLGTSGSSPSYAVFASPDVILYPYPNWTKTGGVIVYGFAVPGAWSTSTTEAATDTFPLKDWARAAVVFYAAWLRCFQQIQAPGNRDRLPLLKSEADTHIGLCARDAATLYGRSV